MSIDIEIFMRKIIYFSVMLLALVSCLKEEDHRVDISYTGEQLRYVSYPLGGIGTGNIIINGYGAIRDIELPGRLSEREFPPYMSFFSLYTEEQSGATTAHVLEREFLRDHQYASGDQENVAQGLPRFKEAVLHNAYPFSRMDLLDDKVPLNVRMINWSPMIPVDPVNSSLPASIIEWELSNPTKEPVSFSVAFALGNPLFTKSGSAAFSSEGYKITPFQSQTWKGVTFSTPPEDSLKSGSGSFRVLFPGNGELSVPVSDGDWWDDVRVFWDDFSSDGLLKPRRDTLIQEEKSNSTAAMFINGKLEPGESVNIPFILSWYVPVRNIEGQSDNESESVRIAVQSTHFTNPFRGITNVSDYICENFTSLRERTLHFSDAMITSSLPSYVIDAVISGIASLKTPLLTQDQNGNLNGLSSSPYVLNDAQILAALYPSLEKNMLETFFIKRAPEYQEKGNENRWLTGKMHQEYNVRVDGYLKNIMRVYREWKISGDNAWLGYVWPGVNSSIEYVWKGGDYEGRIVFDDPLDPLKEGVIRGAQPTTYDMVLYGPNMLTGSLYLGALKACAEMADAMNEPQKAQEFKRIYKRGKQKYQTLLWNGEYYEQSIEISDEERIPNWMLTNGKEYDPLYEKVIDEKEDEQEVGSLKYQVGTGCLSDQLVGQHLAFLSGSGYIMDTLSTQKAFQSIYKYNFREAMRDVENVYSVFAANDDSGLINCSWPGNDRPFLPMVYAEEVWVDVEYRVAASLIFSGQLVEGLNIVEAMRKRYDGSARNPFNAKKTASNNLPALSAWGVYQAMSGYSYNGVKGTMKFSPAEDVLPHRYIWTTDEGWGTITASRAKIELKCLSGELELDKLFFGGNAFFVFREFNNSHPVTISYEDNELVVHFDKSLQLNANESFAMELP